MSHSFTWEARLSRLHAVLKQKNDTRFVLNFFARLVAPVLVLDKRMKTRIFYEISRSGGLEAKLDSTTFRG